MTAGLVYAYEASILYVWSAVLTGVLPYEGNQHMLMIH
jgi:hypothetical protein